jgi:hypothetical protein
MVIRLLLELIARQHIGISNVRLDQEALAYAKRLNDVAEKGK